MSGCNITPGEIKKALLEKALPIAKSFDSSFSISRIGEIFLPVNSSVESKNEPYKLKRIIDKTISAIYRELGINKKKFWDTFGYQRYNDGGAIQVTVSPSLLKAYQVKNNEKSLEQAFPNAPTQLDMFSQRTDKSEIAIEDFLPPLSPSKKLTQPTFDVEQGIEKRSSSEFIYGGEVYPSYADALAAQKEDSYEEKSNRDTQFRNEIKKLPIEIYNSIEIVEEVPSYVLGNTNIFFAIKDILAENGITDLLLVNWVGINKDRLANIKGIKSNEQLEQILKKSYDRKADENKYVEFKSNKLALESFRNWKSALEKYPIVFRDIMLAHAVKYLTNPNRKSKYVLQLSPLALENTYGILMNKPHEANRLGKLYDLEAVASVSDSVTHEPSASNTGYWIHIPKTSFENSEEYTRNIDLLKKLSPHTWCTSGAMSDYYVANYDNYLLIVNGVTVAGIEVEPEEISGKPRKVKEVTSRANNGMASIDHLEDTLAFFEKHNLDKNNPSLDRAIAAKSRTETDIDQIEDEGYLDYLEGMRPDNDLYFEDAPDYYYDIQRRITSLDTVEKVLEEVHLSGNEVFNFFEYFPLEMQQNEQILTLAVNHRPFNITEVTPFGTDYYHELIRQAVTKDPRVFKYLDDLVQVEFPDLQFIYEQWVNENPTYLADLPFSLTNTALIQGYYDPRTDKVVVVSSNTPIPEAGKVAIHEVAHRGMIRMAKELGGLQELKDVLFAAESQLMKKLPELLGRTGHKSLEKLMFDYGFTLDSQEGKAKLLMELAARWAETLTDKPKPSWWKELINSIKNWIKKFTGKDLTEPEVDELVGGFVQYGTKIYTESVSKIKPGVEELFDSNPELANQVYEALGFQSVSNVTLDKPRFNPDNPEAISYPIKINGKYAGIISVDNEGYISSSIGIAGVELEKEFQGKGFGTKVYLALANKLAEEGKTLKSEAFGKQDINDSASRVWKSLIDKGIAIDKGDYFEVTSTIPPQQKQQALQLYSQYLDTGKQDIEGFKEFIGSVSNVQKAQPIIPINEMEDIIDNLPPFTKDIEDLGFIEEACDL